MSKKTRKVINKSVNVLLDAVHLVLIDFTFKKGKYRKRGAKPRPIVQKTIVVRNPAPRVVVVREGQQ